MQYFSIAGDMLDAVIVGIRDVEASIISDGDISRVLELALCTPLGSDDFVSEQDYFFAFVWVSHNFFR